VNRLPKLLVLSTSLPGTRHGGGVVQDEVLRRYPRDRYVCWSVRPPAWGAGPVPLSLQGVPWESGPLLPLRLVRGQRWLLPAWRFLGYRLLAPWRLRQAAAFGRRHRVDLVWGELQEEALLLAAPVAQALGAPLAGTVWDDPEAWLPAYDRCSQGLLRRRFREGLKKARRLSTAGEAMQRAYEREYGVTSVILRHGFEAPAPAPPRRGDGDAFVVGFVGNPYGRDAWEAFLGAAARLNAQGGLPRLTLRVFGPEPFPHRQAGVDLEVRGWQPEAVMLRELAATDLCYLPYWFEAAKRRHVELSFPNKFETYLAAGRPVLYHGPAYAGIARTVRDYGVGWCVHSLDQGAVAAALVRVIQDEPARAACSQASQRAFALEFNAGVMLANFARLIGAAPGELPGAWHGQGGGEAAG